MASREEILDLLERNVRDYAIFLLDPAGAVVSWNSGAQRIIGYADHEVIGRHFSVFFPAEDLVLGKPDFELGIARSEGRVQDEGWRVRKDGSRFWANVVITALYDEPGRLRGFLKITRDMTERWQAEEALAASEERFRLLVQNVIDYAIFMMDATGHIASWNAGAERIKGYAVPEILGRHFSVFYPREDVAEGRPERNLEAALRDGRVEDEGWRVRKDGSRFWASVVITALYDEQRRLRGFAKITRDMTEWRTTTRALDERRRLLAHLDHAQEAERRRIARELQEGSIREIAEVAALRQDLAAMLPEPYAGQLAALGGRIDLVGERLRALTTRLYPPGIDGQPLAVALTRYLAEQPSPNGLKFTVVDRLDDEPSTQTAIAVFRICQEAASNLAGHARATEVQITLSSRDGGVLAELTDNGVADRAAAQVRPGPEDFSEVEMRERAETAGGWWTMSPGPEGMQIRFWIPDLRLGSEEESR